MEILYKNSKIPNQVALILGFFDGIHAGHIEVLRNTPNLKKVLVTFSTSPAEYFGKNSSYIYSREYNYKILESFGVDYIYEQDFSEIANYSADKYLDLLIDKFKPQTITTGFNHTFGANRQGDSKFLESHQESFKYICTPPTIINEKIVSSSLIKQLLTEGNINQANQLLTRNFSIESTVIEGRKIGRELGFPTANLNYPHNIIKIPYGVYKVSVFDRPAVLNWGIKPTFGSSEILEVHIPNFNENLYGKNLRINIISKIRDEQKFNNIEELKLQIKKDIKICLE